MFKPKMIENEKDFFCTKGHKLPVVTIALDPKLSRDERLLCTECLENTCMDGKMVGLRKMIQIVEENQIKQMEKVENIIMDQIKQVEQLHSIVDQMKSFVLQQLNELITILIGWIQNLQKKGQQQSEYSLQEEIEKMVLQRNNTYTTLQPQISEIQKTNFCWISKLHPKLEQFNQFAEYKRCKDILTNIGLESQHITNEQQQINVQKENEELQQLIAELNIQHPQAEQSACSDNLQSFSYDIIQEFSIQKIEQCYAIAINKDCSTLLVGCLSQIKVFEFNQGNIKQIQTLNEHKQYVTTLNFMKKSKQFISGSRDKSIIIWRCDENNLWTLQQRLNGHSFWILCLVLNTNEDLIISGSNDPSIKFWINKNEWVCQQTITDHSSSIYGLSLNQQQNRVISCGYDKLILIMEQQEQNKDWIVIQKIKVEEFGHRICFIDDNIFAFSQYDIEQLTLFEMNPINKQFNKTRDISIKCGLEDECFFPQQYINSKQILLSKNGEYVNLIKKKQNEDFLTEYSIPFRTFCLFGVMSDDGEYLITWDKNSNSIQIRKYKEL
ncbi:unnamed protein product [Paramecium octaurelia]|uniref:Uncharacterized protein n=1 Tax=Paramecium octaurelia TaxID=43137 RepID=A0A8S1Y904_PAROT|nr:unnamed protein product [Paramecium octaurelia]